MEDSQWRVKLASGHVNGRAFVTPTISPKETDCLHNSPERVYLVNVGGKLVTLCTVCYDNLRNGQQPIIHRRIR